MEMNKYIGALTPHLDLDALKGVGFGLTGTILNPVIELFGIVENFHA